MKKTLSVLFTLMLISGAVAVWFIFPDFCQQQHDRGMGMYNIYLGDKELKKGKLQKAIDYYLDGLRLYPENERAWYNLGNIYVVYEDFDSALEAYEKAFEVNPALIAARMNYGVVQVEELGEFDKAIDRYKEILEVQPKLLSIPYIYNNKKSTKINKGLAHYNTGVALKQKYLYNGSGNRQLLKSALEAYEEATKALPKDYDSRYNFALTHHLLGNSKEAGMSYCKAIGLAPMQYEAHYNLAILLRELGFYRESLDEMQKSTTLITGDEGATGKQRYVFDVMNDVTKFILAEDDGDQVFAVKLETKTEPAGTKSVTLVDGKVTATEALDEEMMKNFSSCNALKIFTETMDDDEVNARLNKPQVRYKKQQPAASRRHL